MEKEHHMEIEPTQIVPTQEGVELSEESLIEIEFEEKESRSKNKSRKNRMQEEKGNEGSEIEDEDKRSIQEEDLDEDKSIRSMKSGNIEGDHCEVCYSKVSRKFLQEECKHLFDLISCKTCKKKAHLICYGSDTPLEEKVDENDNIIKNFLCDQCKAVTRGQVCYICGEKDGCLRSTVDGKWIHSLCGVGSSTIILEDVTKMSVDLSSFRKRTQRIPNTKKCSICKSKIQTFKSANKNITEHCHLHCALRHGLVNPEENYWKVYFSQIEDKNLKLSSFYEEKDVISNIEDMSLSLKEVIEETGMNKSGGFKGIKASKAKNKERKTKTYTSKFVKELLTAARDSAKKNLEENTMEIVRENELEEEEEEEDIKCFGGRIVLVKTLGSAPEDQELIQEEEADDIDDYLMEIESSNNLINTIKNLYKETKSNNSLLEVYSDKKIAKLEGDLMEFPHIPKLSFPEVLFFLNVFQKRVKAASDNLCDIKDLEKLIKTVRSFPISIISILGLLNQKYLTGLAADALLESNVKQCIPESAYQTSKKKFDEVTIRRNRNLLEQAKELEDIYIKEPCKVITPQYEDLKRYRKQLAFLDELHREISDYFNYGDIKSGRTTTTTKAGSRLTTPSKDIFINQDEFPNIPLAKLMPLNAKASKVGFAEDFEEIALLRDLLGKPKDLLSVELPRSDILSDISSGKSSPNRSPRKIAEGKRSLPKFVEVIPASAVPFSGSKKGRPKKTEKIVSEIEKEHKIQMRRISELPTLQEAEDALIDAKRSGFQKKIDLTNSSIKKAIEWKLEFEEAIEKNNGSLGALIERIEMIGVYVPEMSRALELRKEWSLWKNKVFELQRRLKKRVENFFDENEDMVTFEELEEVVKEGETIIRVEKDDKDFKELEDKYNSVKKVRDEINDDEDTPSLAHLKQYKKELKHLNVKIPEFETLQKMVAINENLKRQIDESANLRKLEEKLHALQYVKEKVDPNLLQELKTKITEGKRIKEQAEVLLVPRDTYSVDFLSQLALLVAEVNMYKVDVDEIEKSQRIVEDFLRLAKMYALITETEAITQRRLEKGDYLELADKSVDDIIAICQRTLEGNEASFDQKKARDIEEVYRSFTYTNIELPSIKRFLDKISVSLWKIKAKNLLHSDYKRTYEDIKKFTEEIPQIDLLSSEDVGSYRKIQQTGKRYKKWKEDVDSLLRSHTKEGLLDLMDSAEKNDISYEKLQEKLDIVKNRIMALLGEYENELSMFTDLEDEKTAFNKVLGWIQWILHAVEMRARVKETHNLLNYNEVKDSFERMDQLALPRTRGLCKLIGDWYTMAEKVRKEVMEEYEDKKVETKKTKIETVEMKKLIEKNQGKKTLEQARKILEKLESGTKNVVFPEQIESIKSDIRGLEDWINKIKEVKKQCHETLAVSKTESHHNMEIEETDLKREIIKLKLTMLDLQIRDESAEKDLKILEWIYEAIIVVNNPKKDVSYEEYKKLFKAGERLAISEYDDNGERLLDALNSEIKKVDDIRSFVKKIGSSKEKKISYEELSMMIEELQECKIPIKEEKRTLEHVFNVSKKLREKVRNLVEPEGDEKALEEEFKELKRKLKKLPIDFSSEKKLIEDSLDQSHQLEIDASKKTKLKDPQYMGQIVERYKECPILIEKVAKLVKTSEATIISEDEPVTKPKPQPRTKRSVSKPRKDEDSDIERSPKRKPNTRAKRSKAKKTKKSDTESESESEEEILPKRKLRVQLKEKEKKSVTKEIVTNKEQGMEIEDRQESALEIIGQSENEDIEELSLQSEDIAEQKVIEKIAKDTKAEKFLKKCEVLERKRYGSTIGPQVKVTVDDLKKLIKEGTQLQKDFPEEERLERSIRMLEDLFSKGEETIGRLNDVVDLDDLDKYQKILFNIVDISKEYNKKKRQLKNTERKRSSTSRSKERARKSKERERRSKDRSREREKKSKATTSKISQTSEKKTREAPEEKKRIPQPKEIKEPQRKKSTGRSPSTSREEKLLRQQKILRNLGRDIDDEFMGFFIEDLFSQKAKLKRTHLIIAEIKRLLDQNLFLELNYTETFRYATKIFEALPELAISRDSYERILKRRLILLLNSPILIQSIIKMKFDAAFIRHLVSRDLKTLKDIERRLAEEEEAEIWYENIKNSITSESPLGLSEIEDDETLYEDFKIKKKPKQKPFVEKKSQERPLLKHQPKPQPKPTKPASTTIPSRVVQPTPEKEKKRIYVPYNPDDKDKTFYNRSGYYDPESAGKDLESREKIIEIPSDRVLQIFDGVFEWEGGLFSQEFKLYTTAQPKELSNIPALEGRLNKKSLHLTKLIPFLDFEQYFTDVLNICKKKEKDYKVISGWIEPKNPINESDFAFIAESLSTTNQIGVFEYIESASFFFISGSQMKKSWADQLTLQIKPVGVLSQSPLLFIIVHKPHKATGPFSSISAKIVPSVYSDNFEEEIWEQPAESFAPSYSEHRPNYKTYDQSQLIQHSFIPSVNLGKRSYEKLGKAEIQEDDLEELEKLIKRVKNGETKNRERLINQLQSLEEIKIISLAKRLDQPTREYMINILKEDNLKEQTSNQQEVGSLTSQPEVQNLQEIQEEPSKNILVQENLVAENFPLPKPKFTPARFTPQIPTGSTAASPYKFAPESGFSSTKSTPMEFLTFYNRPVTEQTREAAYGEENWNAFRNLQPVGEPQINLTATLEDKDIELIPEEEIEEEDNDEIEIPIDLNLLVPGELDLGGGAKLTNKSLRMPKAVYDKVLDYLATVEEEKKSTEEAQNLSSVEIEDETNEIENKDDQEKESLQAVDKSEKIPETLLVEDQEIIDITDEIIDVEIEDETDKLS